MPTDGLPLVTIVCVCHNHASYVREALESVWHCGYSNLQVIVVDDASNDNSVNIIRQFLEDKTNNTVTDIHILFLDENIGHCKAFNKALSLVKGKYVLDFATDDVLIPGMLRQQVSYIESLPPEFAFCYANAIMIDEQGKEIDVFSSNPEKTFLSGHIYTQIIDGNFICPPTVVFRTKYLKDVGGYDSNLVFEDLDIWLRLARSFPVAAFHGIVIKWRRHKQSSSFKKYGQRAAAHLQSMVLLLNKLALMNTNSADWQATKRLAFYYLRFAIYQNLPGHAQNIFEYLKQNNLLSWQIQLFYQLKPLSLILKKVYQFYFFTKNKSRY